MNGVHDWNLLAMTRQCGLHLQNASGISCCHHIGLYWLNELGLAIPKRVGSVGLHEIEDSRGAAADGGFGNLNKLQPGDPGK